VQCEECKLVQLKDSTAQSEMYEHFYGYRSGINAMMRDHLKRFNDELQSKVQLVTGDAVLDIGSNDCTFLQYYPNVIKRYGCDPTGTQFADFYEKTNTTLFATYFTKSVVPNNIRFKVITSISMFYDLPDPVQFAKDVYDVLDDDGVWALEQSYVGTMLEKNSVDTICHEHLEYYGVKQIKNIMDRSGFKIIDITMNDCNGGSFRVYASKAANKENEQVINNYLEREEKEQIHTIERYRKFVEDYTTEIENLNLFINQANADGKKTYIYGASTKGNCLLQIAALDSTAIPYAVERNPLKVGRTTSTGIEIIDEMTMRANPPQFMLVLPWHFRKDIIEREADFLNNGGQLLFPFPKFEVYSNKPKTLITGIDGQIGAYVEESFSSTDVIYGISNKKTKISKAIRLIVDITDNIYLNRIILLIKPDRIVHLAGISNKEECEKNPIKTINVNGTVTAELCDIIKRNNLKCKLFNASSSELYKGHGDYVINDEDQNIMPTTMYAIAKSLGHQVIEHYRTVYGLPFSNGIIFTTESKNRKETFLLKKVALHAKKYKQYRIPITLGSLDSWRNINHAADVAQAIKLIVEQKDGQTYVICSSNFCKVEDLVIDLYKRFDILVEAKDTMLVDKATGEIVVNIGSSLDDMVTKINGMPTKLLELGWKPMHSVHSILDEL
jgi:GDP-mannose 4,6-dehydratase